LLGAPRRIKLVRERVRVRDDERPPDEANGELAWSSRERNDHGVLAPSSPPAQRVSKLALQALTPEQLHDAMPEIDLHDARQIVAHVHRGVDPRLPSSTIRRSARLALSESAHIPELEVVSEQRSRVDGFVKYALRTWDGHIIETVRIPLEVSGRFVVCVSSQVGCALACAFCATGRLGLTRNLETWEIVEQVRVVRRGIETGRVHGIVFQGMGEPLANVDRVVRAIAVMKDPCALSVDARNITVCTAGIPSAIRRLAVEAPKVRLGLSIASSLPHVRRSLMPIDKAHALPEVLEAAREHARATGLAPMWAVTLLAGVNDTVEHAHALADDVHAFSQATGVRPRVTVIAYNAIDCGPDGQADPFARSSDGAEHAFREALRERGVFTHKRYSGGADVQAACGQLAARPPAAPQPNID